MQNVAVAHYRARLITKHKDMTLKKNNICIDVCS